MKFTREDIEEIKHKLEMLYPPKNDWQLSKCVLPIHGEEEVVIMQRGRNVRCNINDIYRHILSKEFGAFINMDYCNKFPVMSVQEVIAYVDPAYRRKGMVVTFQTPEYHHDGEDPTKGHPVWEIWQFTGEISQWGDLSKWVKLYTKDIDIIKISGAKVEGEYLFLQVGSSWVNTNIRINGSSSIDESILESIKSEIESSFQAYKTETNNIISSLQSKIEELEDKINTTPAPPEDVYALSGSFSYSGNVAASGGTKTPTNTLGITKNGAAISGVSITYSSNQSYATVDSTGKVTFASHTNTSARTATITATVTDGTHTYTKTANITQSAYVAPVETVYTYVGWAKTSAGVPVGIDDFVSKKQTDASIKTFNVTVNEIANTIVILCPSNMTLTLCESQALKEDISSTMDMTTVTYNGKSYKMYQHRYGSSINGTEYKINFN